MFVWIILGLVVALLVYIRLAPHDADRWHRPVGEGQMGETRQKGGYLWREDVGADGPVRLAALDRIIMATPRTARLAGSVDEGQVTYVTRTARIGFPDYTTVSLRDGVLEIYGRLRFGSSDMGVNAKRIKGWLATLKAGG